MPLAVCNTGLFHGQAHDFVIDEILDGTFVHVDENDRDIGGSLAVVGAGHQHHGLQLLSGRVNSVGDGELVLWRGRHVLVSAARDER